MAASEGDHFLGYQDLDFDFDMSLAETTDDEDDSVEDEEEEQQQQLRLEVPTLVQRKTPSTDTSSSSSGSPLRQQEKGKSSKPADDENAASSERGGGEGGEGGRAGERDSESAPESRESEAALGVTSDSSVTMGGIQRSASTSSQRDRRAQIDCWFNIPEMFVDPASRAAYYWLALVTLAVVYNWVVIILRVAFEDMRDSEFHQNVFRALDTLCDVIYLMDVAIQSRTAYLEDGCLVKSLPETVRHYRNQPRFPLDVLSVVPVTTVLAFFSKIGLATFTSGLNNLTTPCLRILRLLKYPSMYRFFEKSDSRTNNPNLLRAFRLSLHLWLVIHWIGCFYYLLSQYEGLGSNDWVYPNGTEDAPFIRKYIICMYWSTMTLTTIGERPWPVTEVEYVFTGVTFLIGVFVFAAVVGNVGDVISNMNAARHDFQARMDQIKVYLNHRSVPEHLQDQIKRWAEYTWARTKAIDEHSVLQLLPHRLRTEVAIHVHLNTLKKVRIFDQCEEGLLRELVVKLRPSIYSPGEYICRIGEIGREMYIIDHGKVEILFPDSDGQMKQVAIMMPGNYFGEISLLKLDDGQNKRTADVRSVGFSELLCLSRRDLMVALGEYPGAKRILEAQARQRMQQTKRKPSDTPGEPQDPLNANASQHPPPPPAEGGTSSPQPGGSPAMSATGRRSARAIFAQVMRQEGFSRLLASAAGEEISEIRKILLELKDLKMQMIRAREMQLQQGPWREPQQQRQQQEGEEEDLERERSPLLLHATITTATAATTISPSPTDQSSDTSTLTSPTLALGSSLPYASPTHHSGTRAKLRASPACRSSTKQQQQPQAVRGSRTLSSSFTATGSTVDARRRRSPGIPKVSAVVAEAEKKKDPRERANKLPREGFREVSSVVKEGGGDEIVVNKDASATNTTTKEPDQVEKIPDITTNTTTTTTTREPDHEEEDIPVKTSDSVGRNSLSAVTSLESDLFESSSLSDMCPSNEHQVALKPCELGAGSSELLLTQPVHKDTSDTSSSSTSYCTTTSTSSGGRGKSPKPAKPRPRYKKSQEEQETRVNKDGPLQSSGSFPVAPSKRGEFLIPSRENVPTIPTTTTPTTHSSIDPNLAQAGPSSSSDVAFAAAAAVGKKPKEQTDNGHCRENGSLGLDVDVFPFCCREARFSGEQALSEVSQKGHCSIPRPVLCPKIDDAQLCRLLAKRREFNETEGIVVESPPYKVQETSADPPQPGGSQSHDLQTSDEDNVPSGSGAKKVPHAVKSPFDQKTRTSAPVRQYHLPESEHSHSVRAVNECCRRLRGEGKPPYIVAGGFVNKLCPFDDTNPSPPKLPCKKSVVKTQTSSPSTTGPAAAAAEDVVRNEKTHGAGCVSSEEGKERKQGKDLETENTEKASAVSDVCVQTMKDGNELVVGGSDLADTVAERDVSCGTKEKMCPVSVQPGNQCDDQIPPLSTSPERPSSYEVSPSSSTADGCPNPHHSPPSVDSKCSEMPAESVVDETKCSVPGSDSKQSKPDVEVQPVVAEQPTLLPVKVKSAEDALASKPAAESSSTQNYVGASDMKELPPSISSSSQAAPHEPTAGESESPKEVSDNTTKAGPTGNEATIAGTSFEKKFEPMQFSVDASEIGEKPENRETAISDFPVSSRQRRRSPRRRGLTKNVNNPDEGKDGAAEDGTDRQTEQDTKTISSAANAENKDERSAVSAAPVSQKSHNENEKANTTCSTFAAATTEEESRSTTASEPPTDLNGEVMIKTHSSPQYPEHRENELGTSPKPQITSNEEGRVAAASEPETVDRTPCLTFVRNLVWETEVEEEPSTSAGVTRAETLFMEGGVLPPSYSAQPTSDPEDRANNCAVWDPCYSSSSRGSSRSECMIACSRFVPVSASLLTSSSVDAVQMDKPVMEHFCFPAESETSLSSLSSSRPHHTFQASSQSEWQDFPDSRESASSECGDVLGSDVLGESSDAVLLPHSRDTNTTVAQQAECNNHPENPAAGSSSSAQNASASVEMSSETEAPDDYNGQGGQQWLQGTHSSSSLVQEIEPVQSVEESQNGGDLYPVFHLHPSLMSESFGSSSFEDDDSLTGWDNDALGLAESDSIFLLSEFGLMDGGEDDKDEEEEGALSDMGYGDDASDHNSDLEDL